MRSVHMDVPKIREAWQKLKKEIEQNINGIQYVYGGREAEQIIEQTN